MAGMKKTVHRSLLFCLLLIFSVSGTAHAVLPPHHYAQQAMNSDIKALAVVRQVIVLSESKQSTRKKIVFENKKGFSSLTPLLFSGTCYSVDHDWQAPFAGGTLYYYPALGQKVLVTVTRNGGAITSYTPLDAALEDEILRNGLTHIEFNMGKAAIRPK